MDNDGYPTASCGQRDKRNKVKTSKTVKDVGCRVSFLFLCKVFLKEMMIHPAEKIINNVITL
jgi:hypothetical protein